MQIKYTNMLTDLIVKGQCAVSPCRTEPGLENVVSVSDETRQSTGDRAQSDGARPTTGKVVDDGSADNESILSKIKRKIFG